MSEQLNHSYEFGVFRLVPAERQLLRDGQPVTLPPKAFDTLVILVQHNGHVVKKDDLLKTVWPDAFVEENNLNQYVSLLRKTLGAGNNGDRYIETVRRYGYRFTADVREAGNEASRLLIQKHTRTQVVVKEEQYEEQKRTVSEQASVATRTGFLGGRIARFGMLALALSLAGGVLAAFLFRPRSEVRHTLPTSNIHSLAVLPFKSLGGQDDDAYLGLGMADALITKIGQIKEVSVRSTSSMQRYAGDARDAATIGRELKVDAVLDGRIQKSGPKIRLTVQLVGVRDGASLWAEKFDQEFDNIFAAQDAIAARVVRGLRPVLTAPEQEKLTKRYTDSQEAYEAYLRGRYLWTKRTTESSRQSIGYFKQAIEKDPNFALAYVGLADTYLIHDVTKAHPTLRKALDLDDTLGETHASLGFLATFWAWDWGAAEPEFKSAIELSPNYATAHQWYALYLAARGRLDEAKTEMRQAIELDPLSPNMNADLGQIYYFAHEYDAAIAQCQKALELDPNFLFAHSYLSHVYAQKGMHLESVKESLECDQEVGRTPREIASLREAYLHSGWRGFLRALLEREKIQRMGHAEKASTYALLGDQENAIKELERAYDNKEFFLTFVQVEPEYDDLRSDPRFQDLLRRMRLRS